MTVVFNFKQQFADAVADFDKLQTVRVERKDGRRPRVGETVKLYTGLRTKKTRLLATGVVEDCFSVRFDMAHEQVYIDNDCLSSREANEFAEADGFDDAGAMLTWFVENHGERDFSGYCTRWAPATAVNPGEKP